MRASDWLRRNFERIWESELLKREIELALRGFDKLPDGMTSDELEVFFVNFIINSIRDGFLNIETMLEGERRVFENDPLFNKRLTTKMNTLRKNHQRNPENHDKFSFERTQFKDILFVERKFNEQ